jgi:hypothetical protein
MSPRKRPPRSRSRSKMPVELSRSNKASGYSRRRGRFRKAEKLLGVPLPRGSIRCSTRRFLPLAGA